LAKALTRSSSAAATEVESLTVNMTKTRPMMMMTATKPMISRRQVRQPPSDPLLDPFSFSLISFSFWHEI
jgi:hypothetical protein